MEFYRRLCGGKSLQAHKNILPLLICVFLVIPKNLNDCPLSKILYFPKTPCWYTESPFELSHPFIMLLKTLPMKSKILVDPTKNHFLFAYWPIYLSCSPVPTVFMHGEMRKMLKDPGALYGLPPLNKNLVYLCIKNTESDFILFKKDLKTQKEENEIKNLLASYYVFFESADEILFKKK